MLATTLWPMPFGARALSGGGVTFRLFAPSARAVAVAIEGSHERTIPLARVDDGFLETTVAEAAAGTRYRFDIDGTRVPDPASRFQPEGPHGPSVVVDPAAYAWRHDFVARPWNETIFYELHVGSFTRDGTYAAAAERLEALVELGITAVELMPLAAFPGARNWGYDGVLPFAPTQNYGSPDDLRAFVDRAHALGIAVYLDVVYNHFGPEANYLHGYAPEFYTERHHTPWGAAIDVEAAERDGVRAFFIANAIHWLREYRMDGLRLDAVHAIYDGEGRAFLTELASTVTAAIERRVHLVVENEDNESSLLERGFRAQWNDDAHHAAHVIATGERDGYFSDYASDPIARLGRTITAGFGYQGEPSERRGGVPRGEPSGRLPQISFVNFMQNHDQIGNRPFGDRIASLAPDRALRALLGVLLLAPPIPLLFMGEEWAASSPFLFFCDFEPDLARAVTEGRRKEFGEFAAFADEEARERIPDPSAPETFERSVLDWSERSQAPHASWLAFYTQLLHIRRREIAPRIATVTGAESRYERFGEAGLRATWRLDDGTTLALEANLGDAAHDGFSTHLGGLVVYSSHDPSRPDGIAPPWSVRWTIA